MSFWNIPWLEITILTPLLGALLTSGVREPARGHAWGLAFTGAALIAALIGWLGFQLHGRTDGGAWSLEHRFFANHFFAIDELNLPLIPLVALLHFLTSLATTRTKMRRYSTTWSLAAESIRLAAFSCKEPWLLISLISIGVLPPLIEMLNRGKPSRVFVLHMSLFIVLMTLGWTFVDSSDNRRTQTAWATLPLMLAILVRCGAVPLHCWVTDWCENASFGNALLYITPLVGVYAAVRLVLPIAPDWTLRAIGIISLLTALYTAGLGTVQRDARRFFAYFFLSHASLVLVGLELHTPISLTGSLCLWLSVTLSLSGFGLVLRALEARYGRLSLNQFHGLYDHSPTLAICFLLLGLGSVGFPGTIGFESAELLVDGAIEANLYVGIGVVIASALNGIAVVRVYFLLFTGKKHSSTINLEIAPRERIAILALASLIVLGGLFPQPVVNSRHLAAESILRDRESRIPHSETVSVFTEELENE